jgi:adenosylcobinamide-phosphate synthase
MTPWLPLLAFLLDFLLADPDFPPHPVRAIGKLADRLERPARRMGNRVTGPLLAGGLALLLLLAAAGGLVAALTRLPSGLGALAAVYFSWAGLALGGLIREGEKALAAVRKAGENPACLPEARTAVQMLVSRDCADMPLADLYRALAESISENFNDAFVAPYFWLCLGGPVALWLYKTASTMDSLWGYRNERFLYFGRAAARLDDALAFVPARLSALLLYLTALRGHAPGALRPGRACPPRWPGWKNVARDARQSASPNAGWPMAVAAWLFDGKNGGPTMYDGQVRQKPLMGPAGGCWNADNTALLIRHVRLAGLAGGLPGAGLTARVALFFLK